MRKYLKSPLLALLAALAATPAFATDYLTPYVGYFDLNKGDHDAAQFGLEYRAEVWDFGIRPTVGFNVTTDGSYYIYGGFNWDIKIAEPFYIVPSFVAGGYSQGDGKDLGGAIEFRSGIEFDYQFENESRVGIAFNHISNASIYDKNPGAETLLVNYSYPLGGLLKWNKE